MSNSIKVKRSNVSGKVPTTTDISAGELAINTFDPALYYGTGSAVIKVGKDNGVTSGWRDLVGNAIVRGNATNDPTWEQVWNNFYAYAFNNGSQMKQMWFVYHPDHDFKTGSSIFVHVHWTMLDSETTPIVNGVLRWDIEVCYAAGYGTNATNEENKKFDSITYPAITTSVESTITSSAYNNRKHFITEVELTGSFINNIETDGLIWLRLSRTATQTADTFNSTAYVLTCDLHYQTDHFNTSNRNRNTSGNPWTY